MASRKFIISEIERLQKAESKDFDIFDDLLRKTKKHIGDSKIETTRNKYNFSRKEVERTL